MDTSAWADVVPIPLRDGADYFQNTTATDAGALPDTDDAGMITPLATIAYPAPYAEGMAYLRAAMGMDEVSERALALTEELIRMNPAHYTVWYVS